MFGFGKRNNQQQAHIPYELYESVQQPTYRRRRWLIRLVVILALVTLLVFVVVQLVRQFGNNTVDEPGPSTTQEQQSTDQNRDTRNTPAPESVSQPVQGTPTPTTGTPATGPQSDDNNDKTVRKPE